MHLFQSKRIFATLNVDKLHGHQQPRSQGLSSLPPLSMEAEKRDPGNEVGAPNDQFVVKCIIIPQLMKINVIKAFSGVFQCCWENIICSFFPERHTRNFPAS